MNAAMKYTELRYQPEKSGIYVGSPSLLRLPDGALLASHDYFEADPVSNLAPRISEIYRSEDGGASWRNVNHLSGALWGSLFLHDDCIYHLGTDREYGSIVIRRSRDGGFSWSDPQDERTGLLFRGGPGRTGPNYHFGGATPVAVHRGRVFRACELFSEPDGRFGWDAASFRETILSAPDDADLLNADNWTLSRPLAFDAEQLNTIHPGLAGQHSGWLEGNLVTAPDGSLADLMRVHLNTPNKAALLEIAPDGSDLSFRPETGIIDFPGGASKFTVRRDPATGLYFTLSNPVTMPECPWQRNILSLCCSGDLRNWKILKNLLTDDTGLPPEESVRYTGFQYADWEFDGDDLIYLVRMSYRGARNYHDSNRITFHRERNFRRATSPDSGAK